MNAYRPALVLLAIGLACLAACGGDLEHPERFDKLLHEGNDAGSVLNDAAVAPRGDGGGGMTDAGSSSGAGSSPGSAEPPACVTKIFKDTCGTVGCHAAKQMQVDLVSAGVTARLVDQKSASATCKDRVFIATDGKPSLLLQKLSATPPCGAKMPLVGTLTSANEDCLNQWVMSLGGTVPGGN
jgi:hypothetical protein